MITPMKKLMEQHIRNQVSVWSQQKNAIANIEEKPKKPFITLSREYGVGAFEVAGKLVETLNSIKKPVPEWAAYDKELLNKVSEDLGLSKSLADTLTSNARNQLTEFFQTSFSKFPTQVAVYRKLAETVTTMAYNGNVIIVGRAGNVITKGLSNGFHVRMIAPAKWKINRLNQLYGMPVKEAEQAIVKKDKERDSYIREFLKFDNADPINYHMVLNMGDMTSEEASKIIAEAMVTLNMV
jgi:cytidylate kinase